MSMKLFCRFVLPFFTASMAIYAQVPDSARIYGKLVEITPTTIRYIDFLSSSSDIASARRTARTVALGCSFEDVQPGVGFSMELEDTPGALTAARVVFESCAPLLFFSGTVLERTADRVQLGTIQGGVGGFTEAVVLLTAASGIYTCEGMPVTSESIRIGDRVSVAVTDINGTYSVVSLSINERCATYRSEQMTFLELVEGGARFRREDEIVVFLVFNSQMGGPLEPDSVFGGYVYTCTGEMLRWEDLLRGQRLRVSYVDNAETDDVLMEAVLEEGCPQHVEGRVVAVTLGSIDIQEPDGTVHVYEVGSKTEIWSCRGATLTIADVRIGARVKGTWLEDESRRVAHYLQITDGCSFAFGTTGMLTSISDSAITLVSQEVVSEIYLRVDAQSIAIDCDGEVQPVTSFQVGDTVMVFYRGDESGAYLDLLQSIGNCRSLRVHGIVANVIGSTVITIDGENGTQTLLVGDESQLFDCTGAPLTVSADIIGKEIGAKLNARDSLPTISYAWVNINCVKNVVSGRVMRYSEGVLTVVTDSGVDTVLLSDATLVAQASGVVADRAELQPGRVVCVFIEPMADGVRSALHIILDSDCGVTTESGIRLKGRVVSIESGLLQLDVDGKPVSVAVHQSTNVHRQHRGRVDASVIATGDVAMVITGGRLANGTPVAESVVLMDAPTSVPSEGVEFSFAVHPNPATEQIALVGLPSNVSRIEIVDVMGRPILTEQSMPSTINCARLSQGAYIVRAYTTNGFVATTPLRINR